MARSLDLANPMVTQFLRLFHASILVGGLTLTPVAHALKIQVNTRVALRAEQSARLDHVSTIEPGSVVEIPDRYAVKDSSGRVNAELTLNQWLSSAGYQQNDIDGRANGQNFDYFFPVRVASAPTYSGVNPIGSVYYVSLRTLARTRGALVVQERAALYSGPSDDTPLKFAGVAQPQQVAEQEEDEFDEEGGEVDFDEEPAPRPSQARSQQQARYQERPQPAPIVRSAPAQMSTDSEAIGPCATGCDDPTPTVGGPLAALRALVKPALDRVTRRAEENRERTTQVSTIEATFRQSCGFELSEFLPEVEKAAQAKGVPASVLLSLMSQESMGDCFLRPGPNHANKGLMQINPISASVRSCTAAQKAQILGVRSVAGLRNAPQCLENPIVNINEGARVLKQKMDTLMNTLPSDSFRSSNGMNGWSPAAWRMAATAYNHGEAYALDAYRDLKDFNAHHGTSYQASNWEDMKVFYLRNFLDRNQQIRHYGRAEGANRTSTRTILNLGYAENIVPTVSGNGGTTYETWSRYLRSR